MFKIAMDCSSITSEILLLFEYVLLQVVTTIRNITYQHRDFQYRLRNVERLQLYSPSIISNHKALSASLAEAESSSRR